MDQHCRPKCCCVFRLRPPTYDCVDRLRLVASPSYGDPSFPNATQSPMMIIRRSSSLGGANRLSHQFTCHQNSAIQSGAFLRPLAADETRNPRLTSEVLSLLSDPLRLVIILVVQTYCLLFLLDLSHVPFVPSTLRVLYRPMIRDSSTSPDHVPIERSFKKSPVGVL